MRAVTFEVSPEVGLGKRLEPIHHEEVLEGALQGTIEGLWTPASPLVTCSEKHQLVSAVCNAFFRHYPLTLTPDAVWLTLARGFALHVNEHAEELRGRFVSHAGREVLTVTRTDILPGRNVPWGEVFEQFGDLVEERVGKLRQFLRCDYSTTGPVERAASDLIVMETFKAYFEYVATFGCGIPSITLTGTVEDWKSIRNRAALFGEYGLETWSRALDPVLAQFVAAAEGRADRTFWQSMFRYRSGSGPSVMTGWLNTFFPYHQDQEGQLAPNPCLADWEERFRIDEAQHWEESWANPQGFGIDRIPPCLTSVPLKVFWGEREEMLRLVGGLMGVSQDPETLSLKPECGWAVLQGEPSPEPTEGAP